MILVDANLLIYASIISLAQHKKSKEWLDMCLNSESLVGIPWASIVGFLRIVTNPRIFNPPVTPNSAWKVVEYWLDCKPVWIPQPNFRDLNGKIPCLLPHGKHSNCILGQKRQ